MRAAEQRRWSSAAGALIGLALLVVGVPWALIQASLARFGSGVPWAGVAPPWTWRHDGVGDALSGRLSDSMLADVTIRLSIAVIWVAVVLVSLTVVAEVSHRLRHGGLGLPAVRGIGWSQSIARWMATGLLVLVPHVAAAKVSALPLGIPAARAAITMPFGDDSSATRLGELDVVGEEVSPTPDAPEGSDGRSGRYLVAAGDSILGIAERLSPDDRAAATRLADHIVDLNLGAVMPDGQRFTNAALLEEGWVLRLPPGVPSSASAQRAPADNPSGVVVHTVASGDTLWSIAGDHLDDPARWPEIWERNAGAEMSGGRVFDDPDLILAGWELEVAVDDAVSDPTEVTDPERHDGGAGRQIVWDPGPAPTLGTATEPVAAEVLAPGDPTSSATPVVSEAPAVVESRAPDGDLASIDLSQWETQTRQRSGWVGPGQALMLSVGALSLVAVRRRRRLRQTSAATRLVAPSAGPIGIERALRTHDAAHRLVRVDLALRAAAETLAERDVVVTVAIVGSNGAVEVWLSGPAELPAPWTGAGLLWTLPGTVTIEQLTATGRSVGAPSVALVQLGVAADGRDVYLDLESVGSLALVTSPERSRAVVNGIAATLGSSAFAEVAHLVGVGVDPSAFLGHRSLTVCESVTDALDTADQFGVPVADRSTFALRARAAGGEAWEPVVIIVDHAAVEAADDLAGSVTPSHGIAMVVGADISDAGCRLVDTGDLWRLEGPRLEPAGSAIDLVPVGLGQDELAELIDLVEQADVLVPEAASHGCSAETIDASSSVAVTESPLVDGPEWSLLVRLLGPVEVTDHDGATASFDRSKSLELIVWLATHRQRSTRSAARTALWELDVRDATFANVVSDARRTMARLVAPPAGAEWLGRTLTEDLPLHPAVVTDAHLLEHALTVARSEPDAAGIQLLDETLGLVRGLPFEGTSYLWPDAEGITSNLVILTTSAAIELATRYLERRDVEGVFRATSQGLLVLPGHEELIALRMRAHALGGDRAGVRHEWEAYQRVIVADPWSDGEPAPKLVALRRELLSSPV